MRMLILWLMLVAAVAGPVSAGPGPGAFAEEQVRGVWVTRWDYLTEADVARAMAEIAGLGMTDVFWQVRGQGDAFYRSDLEPWGQDLFREPNAGKANPGFDPLEVAVREAHARGLRLHAWMNVMPLWRRKVAPSSPSHAFHTRPEWRLVDQRGERQPLNDHYVIVNPLRPDVRDHIVAVGKDIVTRYAVDGLHLDYVRFVTDAMDEKLVYPCDADSLALLEARTGSRDVSTPAQRAALRGLIRESITEIVRRLDAEAAGARAGVVLTAAVWRRPELARDRYEQDAAAWLESGLIDAAMPMIYTENTAQLCDDTAAWRAAAPRGRIITGLGAYQHASGETTLRQIDADGVEDFALFAYSSLFDSRSPDQDDTPAGVQRRELMSSLLRKRFSGTTRD